jgi:hypothetical protein
MESSVKGIAKIKWFNRLWIQVPSMALTLCGLSCFQAMFIFFVHGRCIDILAIPTFIAGMIFMWFAMSLSTSEDQRIEKLEGKTGCLSKNAP